MFRYLPLRDLRPEGWLAARMRRDLDGFVGHLDELAPDLIIADDIYGQHRISRSSQLKDVGALMDSEDPDAALQFMWWNSETQSNWRDGWLRHIMCVGTETERALARSFVERLLSTIGPDGYLGIYAPDLRFPHEGENGELWAQATAGRVLLGYIESTSDPEHAQQVLAVLAKAVDVTMAALMGEERLAFAPNCGGGGSHGLAFTDVLDRLADLTGRLTYRRQAAWLYNRFSSADVSEDDAAIDNLLDAAQAFKGHGVHTYEHLRSLVVAAEISDDAQLDAGLDAYLAKLRGCVTPAGGPIGDEWIAGQQADASETGYEFCSTVELMDSLLRLMVSTGDLRLADAIENTCLNAGFGAWHPDLSAIAYLQTDNAISMAGQRFGMVPDGIQTRYRYSPLHRQAAVCCVPNAGRMLPTYLRSSLLREGDDVVIAGFAPMTAKVLVRGVPVQLRVETAFPDELGLTIHVSAREPVTFAIAVRHPGWADDVLVDPHFDGELRREQDRVVLHREWLQHVVRIDFAAEPRFQRDERGDGYVSYGPRRFALPVPSDRTISHDYGVAGLVDVNEVPTSDEHAHLALATDRPDLLQRVLAEVVEAPFRRLDDHGRVASDDIELHLLLPLGATPLRRLTFPVTQLT